MKIAFVGITFLVATLSACGGSGVVSEIVSDVPETALERAVNEFNRLDSIDYSAPTGFDSVPTHGTPSYEGIYYSASTEAVENARRTPEGNFVDISEVVTADDPVIGLIGDMGVSVNFSDASLTGEATNFVNNSGERLDGSLDFSGVISSDRNQIDGTFTGELQKDGDTQFSTGGLGVRGAFYGPDAEEMFVSQNGSIILVGPEENPLEFSSGFIAKRTAP